MTGGGRGYCAVPVGGRPLGVSWGARSYASGGLGRGRGGFGLGLQRGFRGRWAPVGLPPAPARWVDLTYDDELAELHTAATQLEGDLEGIRARIEALEAHKRRETSYEAEAGGQAG